MSKATDYFWLEPFVKTLQTIQDCAKNQKFSCVHQSLLEIPLENVVLDELHLMLRVTGTLNILAFIFLLMQHSTFPLPSTTTKN